MGKVTVMVLALWGIMLVTDVGSSPTFPNPFGTVKAEATVRWVNGYVRSDGRYVQGHYRDTSGNGNPYDNASYLGY